MQTPQALAIETQLRHFYAPNSSDTELEALLAGLRPTILQRLRKGGIEHEDLEDLTAESVRRLLIALRRSHDGGARITDAVGYARRVAQHVLIDHIHRGRMWRQWKRRIIELLDGKWGGGLFARWMVQAGWLGGFAKWRGRPFRATPRYREFCGDAEPFCREALKGRDAAQTP